MPQYFMYGTEMTPEDWKRIEGQCVNVRFHGNRQEWTTTCEEGADPYCPDTSYRITSASTPTTPHTPASC